MRKRDIGLVFLATIFITIDGYSQSRNSATKNVNIANKTTVNAPISVKNKSNKLKFATGWKLDSESKWVSNVNAIGDIALNSQTQTTVPQNFQWIQFLELNINNQDMYAILFENSAYISPTKTEKRVHFYIFKNNAYANLINYINGKDGTNKVFSSNIYGYMSNSDGIYNQEKLFQQIQTSISMAGSNQYDFVVNSQYVDNKDVIRFRLPEQSSIMSGGMRGGYFEVDYKDFTDILIPVSETKVLNDEFDLDLDPTSSLATTLIESDEFEISNTQLKTKKSKNDIKPVQDSIVAINTAKVDNSHEHSLAARTEKKKAKVSGPFSILDDVKGWYKNDTGEWVDETNYTYNFETVGKYEMRNMKYHNADYIIFIKYEKYAGTKYHLINKDDYKKALSDIKGGDIVRLPVICHVSVGYTLEDFIEKAEEVIDTPISGEKIIIKEHNLVIQYKASDVRNVARFFIFDENCTQYGEYGSKTCDVTTSSKIKYDDRSLLLSDLMFGKMYYESTYDEFSNFLLSPYRVEIQLEEELETTAPSTTDWLEER